METTVVAEVVVEEGRTVEEDRARMEGARHKALVRDRTSAPVVDLGTMGMTEVLEVLPSQSGTSAVRLQSGALGVEPYRSLDW